MVLVTIKKRNRKEKVEVTVKKLVQVLFKVMREHIGMNNAIERSQLFKEVYGFDEDEVSDLHYFVFWDMLKRAMHFCRRNTKCFITNHTKGLDRYYFVIKDDHDAQCYTAIMDNIHKKMQWMNKRAQEAVQNKWYKYEWVVEKKEDF